MAITDALGDHTNYGDSMKIDLASPFGVLRWRVLRRAIVNALNGEPPLKLKWAASQEAVTFLGYRPIRS